MSAPPEPPPEPTPDRNNPETPTGRRPEPTDREVDDAFAALVAGWDPPTTADVDPTPGPPAAGPPALAPRGDVVDLDLSEEDPFADDRLEDEGHFERPDAPPVTPPTRAAMGAIAFLVLGLVLVVVPGLLGLTGAVGFPLGLVCISSGLVVLLSRLRSGPPTDTGWDDGAQL